MNRPIFDLIAEHEAELLAAANTPERIEQDRILRERTARKHAAEMLTCPLDTEEERCPFDYDDDDDEEDEEEGNDE